MNSFESAAFERLQRKIDEAVQRRAEDLANGSALTDDPQSTGARYEAAVAYFQALRDVSAMMAEVERDLLGRTKE